MISINAYLDFVLNDFIAYLDENHNLCNLKSVNFDQGQIPDYQDIHVQQYYLLRYAYAYAFEYKQIYKTLFKNYTFSKKITVTSIGCGTMLDYWALVRVLKQTGHKEVSVKYTGIDQIAWQYLFPPRKKDLVVPCLNNIVAEFSQYSSLDSDIYFFPKSISEFSNDDFNCLCDVFEKVPIDQDVVHILISVRSNQGSMARDLERAELLRKSIIKNGFETENTCDNFWHAKNPEEMIRIADSDFEHPSDIIDALIELNAKCVYYQDEHADCDKDCKIRLTRWPILKQGQVCFSILSFERKKYDH